MAYIAADGLGYCPPGQRAMWLDGCTYECSLSAAYATAAGVGTSAEHPVLDLAYGLWVSHGRQAAIAACLPGLFLLARAYRLAALRFSPLAALNQVSTK